MSIILLKIKKNAVNRLSLFFLLTLILVPVHSYAYIGPGMAGGVIIAVIGFFVAVILGLFGILYYPIKRLIKYKRKKVISDKNSHRDHE